MCLLFVCVSVCLSYAVPISECMSAVCCLGLTLSGYNPQCMCKAQLCQLAALRSRSVWNKSERLDAGREVKVDERWGISAVCTCVFLYYL